MQKHIVSFVALVVLAQGAWAGAGNNPVTPPANIPSYWASADGKSGSALWSAVSAATNVGYSSIGYSGLYDAYKKTDVYPADSVGKAGKVWDMYGECVFSFSNTCGNYSGVCDCYNREHSIPQSWWGGGTSGIGNDIFHVLPTDGKVNGVRSNYEYGVVNGGTNWVGNKYGSASSWSTDRKTIASTAGESVNGSGNVFEPKPQYKGDIARGLMGTIIKWQQSNITQGNNFFSGNYTATGNFGLTKKAVVLLMKWHREDPVSQKEIDRNNGIQITQGNRNPFIDYPYLVEYIWGEKAGETVDMSMLMASCDPAFVPGVSSGWRGETIDPQPGEPVVKYGVNWSVNGDIERTDSVAENGKVSALPATPVSCSSESNVFAGWSDMPISGTQDEAPEVLYTAAGEIPAITEDITLYAVFAKEETDANGATPASYVFDAEHQEGWTNTASLKGSYWLLNSNGELISPEINLAGLESIAMTMRTYGGSSFNTVTIHANDQQIGSLQAKSNSLAEQTWMNTQSLTGNAAIHFKANYQSNGVGFSAVTINATGSSTTYSRYITSCQGTTEVIALPAEQAARKIMVGGRIYILVGEQMYNMQGQRIR